MACSGFRVILLAFRNRRLQVRDARLGVLVVFGLFRRFRVCKRGFCMRHEHFCVTLLAMFDRFFRVADCLGEMILSQGQPRRKKGGDRKAKREREISTVQASILPNATPPSGMATVLIL